MKLSRYIIFISNLIKGCDNLEAKNNTFKNYLYINSIYTGENSEILEGGMSRDYAFMNWIQNKVNNCKINKLQTNKFINIYSIFMTLMFKKSLNIIFQYPRIGIPIYNCNFLGKIISSSYINLIKFASKNNNIIFDISDIKYEQLIDLNIDLNNKEYIKKFENKFFRLSVNFIFESNSMREYACKKYLIDIKNTDVCINGGIECTFNKTSVLEKYIIKNKINCIYAGTLNKG